MKDFSEYQSAFSWRYGSAQMRKIFSEKHKFELWRSIWVNLAEVQSRYGLVSKEELSDLKKNQNKLDVERLLQIEEETRHDLVAGIREFAEKARVGGGKIHLGATSMDVVDNADMIRQIEALSLIEDELKSLLGKFSEKIRKYSNHPCMGYTHLQPAEPTTIGYRLSLYAQDLLTDLAYLRFVKQTIKGKGFKGAVGTSASYTALLDEKKAQVLDLRITKKLGLETSLVSSQTYPRKYDYLIATLLSSIAQSLSKFALDLRIMQSGGFGEWQEPFGASQVGSSAMPFKKNPMKAEQICSLARLVVTYSVVMWENASNSALERTLDDSANKRVAMPEMFLAVDEMLVSAAKIIEGLIIHQEWVRKNLQQYWPFSATEGLIIKAVKKEANRQVLHEALREISMKAWTAVQEGKENPMLELVLKSPKISKYLSEEEIKNQMKPTSYLGDAPRRSLLLVKEIVKNISK